jgi:murein DD-endopeptidase MepM/ murein hydrolase activator NlpD
MAAAASGALTMPQAGASNTLLTEASVLAPERPQNDGKTTAKGDALEPVVAAGESLASQSAEGMQQAHKTIQEEQRKEAAEREARRQREAQRYVKPMDNYRVSATFGSSGSLWSGTHTGIDMAASYGTEVRSVTTGEITFAGWDGAYGNKIVVRHWDGTETWYAHLSRIVKRSGTVAPGDLIGAVGSTGNSTGPHLHLEVHPSGSSAVDPRPYFAQRGVNL